VSTIGGTGSRGRWFFGRLSSVLGILLSLTGIFFVNNVLTLSLLGIVLGALGTVLGTRRIGIAAVVVSVVVLLFGLAVFSGLIPGLDAPGYNDQVPEEYE
jgi:hypothetical protein